MRASETELCWIWSGTPPRIESSTGAMRHRNVAKSRQSIHLSVARFLTPTNNMIFNRFATALIGVSSRLLSAVPHRTLCTTDSCHGVPQGALQALLRLASTPAVHAKTIPVPHREMKTEVPGQPDKKDETDTSSSVRFPAADRIIAIGDVHGDYHALRGLLRRSGLIGRNGDWVGGKSVLVQVGDQLDRGDGERAIYDLLFKLQDTAPKSGGAVHILLGNHEMMNFNLDFRYVTPGGFADFINSHSASPASSVPKHFRALIKALPPPMRPRAAALVPGGALARQLAERAKVAVIVGDSVFVHAGLAPSHLGSNSTSALSKLNSETQAFLLGKRLQLPKILESNSGPLWMRTYSSRSVQVGGPACQLLSDTLKLLGVRRMVVGHTVQPAINAACGGRVWRVDTGISSVYGGTPEALEILKGGRTQVVTPRGGIVDGKTRYF